MKARIRIFVIILAALFTACREHSLPRLRGHLHGARLSSDLHEIPPGRYDALFKCSEIIGSNTKEKEDMYVAAAEFFDDSGKSIPLPADLRVTLNGDTVGGAPESRVELKYPEKLTWRVSGNGHYSSITHTLSSDSSIEFLAPDTLDSAAISQGFVVRYHAPQDIDSVELLISYRGEGISRRDTLKKVTKTGQDYWEHSRNTGWYFVQPFLMRQDLYRSFNPESILVLVRWSRGDTVHAGPYVYGFVTDSHAARDYRLKN